MPAKPLTALGVALVFATATLDGADLGRRQSKLQGLLVSPLATGENAGMASQMNATAIPSGRKGEPLNVTFNQDVGEMMGGALKEVIKFLRVRHRDWPKGYDVEIAFENRYTSKDGPSAATACALLLDSLVTGAELDAKFAVTGYMNADGSVRPVGGVPAKVRGAFGKDCEIVAIPAENVRSLSDLVITDGVGPIARIQIFSLETFDQARALAVAEKEERLKQAIAGFAMVQKAMRGRGAGILRNAKVQQKLAEVLELAPNHVSASLMLDHALGRSPTSLSLLGALESIAKSAATLLLAARDGKAGSDSLAPDELAKAVGGLRRVRSKLDRRTWAYADSIQDFGSVVREFQNAPPRGVPMMKKKIAEIADHAKRIESEARKIRNDKAMMEELMR